MFSIARLRHFSIAPFPGHHKRNAEAPSSAGDLCSSCDSRHTTAKPAPGRCGSHQPRAETPHPPGAGPTYSSRWRWGYPIPIWEVLKPPLLFEPVCCAPRIWYSGCFSGSRRQYECAWVGGQVPGMVLAGQQHAVQSVLDWLRAWAWPFLWGPQRPSGVDDTRGIGSERGQRRMHAPHG